MTIANKNTGAKVAAVVAGAGLVAMSFASFAVPASAQTSSVQAQIAALQAQLAALMSQAGTSTGACTSFMANLTVGSKGADVTALQNLLISQGFSIPAGATGFFGAQTKAAVAAWQAKSGISPAAGFFGPLSRAHVNAQGCTTGVGGGNGGTTTGLTGAGYLTSFSTQGDIVSDVREGDVGDKVVGISARAVGGDLAVDRLDVSFDMTSSTGSTNLNQYVNSVSVWLNGQKLATMDPTQGSYQSKVWTLRFNNLGGVIKSGTTATLYVAVDAVSSVGSTESGQTVKVSIPPNGLRVNDAQGVSDTYEGSIVGPQSFTVSAANTGKLTLTEASDDPAATTIKADPNNTTTNVTLLAFNAKATNQNITVRSLPVNLVMNSASTHINDVIQSVSLMQGGTTLSTKTVTSTASSSEVTFDNLNQNISKDSTTEYTVVATIKKIDATTFVSGNFIFATSSNDSAWDVADSQGNTVAPTGAVQGHNQTFQQTGITVSNAGTSFIKTTGTNAGQADSTQYSISFKMTAGDQDLYVNRTITRLTSPSTTATAANGVQWATTTSSTASTTHPTIASNLSAADTNSGDASNGTYYKIPAGTSRTFTLNVTLTSGGPAGFTGVQLVGIGYGTTTTTYNSGGVYTSGLDQFKTADVSMTVH